MPNPFFGAAVSQLRSWRYFAVSLMLNKPKVNARARIALVAILICGVASQPSLSSIELSSSIRVVPAHWAALQFALSCWTSRGSWVAHSEGYEWTPDPACPPYTTNVSNGIACGIAARLQGLSPRDRHGLPVHAFFLGDSLTHQYYRGFLANSPRSVVHSPLHSGTYSDCKFARPALPVSSCEAAAGQPLSATYRRADRLAPQSACGSNNQTVGFTDTDWVAELRPKTSIVLLNRGAHFESDDKFVAGWRTALRLLRQRAPHALLVARTTPGGHDDCTKFAAPVSSSSLFQQGYSWRHMPRQNIALQRLVEEEFPGVILLDIEFMASLRPDAHVGIDRMRGGKLDCLHFLEGPGAAGMMNGPHFLLYNALWLLEDLHTVV